MNKLESDKAIDKLMEMLNSDEIRDELISTLNNHKTILSRKDILNNVVDELRVSGILKKIRI
jgi:hypothetical protein